MLIGVVPLRKIIPAQHLRFDDALCHLGNLAVRHPDVVDLRAIVGFFPGINDDLFDVGCIGCHFGQVVPVALVDDIDRMVDLALRVDSHAHLSQMSIIGSVVQATLLDDQYRDLLASFMEKDRIANLFGLCVLERWGVSGMAGLDWWGVLDAQGNLQAVCYAGDPVEGVGYRLVVPMGMEEGARLLGKTLALRGGARWVVGDRAASDALWAGMGHPSARVCADQVLFECTAVTEGKTLSVRRGQTKDLAWIQRAAAGMTQEDTGLQWAGNTPDHFSSQIRQSIQEGNEILGLVDGAPVYRMKKGMEGSAGAQIGGIWVEPAARGKGYGQAGTRSVTSALLQRGPRVTLHVRADNKPAIRCYEAVGYTPVRAFRMLVR